MRICSQADRFASTPSTGKSVYVHAFVHRYVHTMLVWVCILYINNEQISEKVR